MEITVLGSGTALPSATRVSPGFAVSLDGALVLLDGGSGTLWRLAQAGFDYRSVTHLCYTHLHPDHIGDLVPFLFASRNPGQPRTIDLQLIGPQGVQSYLEQLRVLYGDWIRAEGYVCTVTEMRDETLPIGGGRLTARPVRHTPHSVAYRVDAGGRALVYSGDTDVCPEIVELARGADLFISECSFPDERKQAGHLTPSEVGRIAREAGCRRVLLTHFYPPSNPEQAKVICARLAGCEVAVAQDLMRVVL